MAMIAPRWGHILIKHLGYQDSNVLQVKAHRNLGLLLLEDRDRPGNPFVLFNIGRTYKVLGRHAEAIQYWRRSLALTPPQALFQLRLFTLLVAGLEDARQTKEALAVCLEGRRHFPEDLELLFHEGTLRIELRELPQAENCLHRVLNCDIPFETAQEEPLLRSKCWHNLAVVALQRGQPAAAETCLRHALLEQPGYTIAWQGLGQIWLRESRWEKVEEAIRHLEADAQLTPIANQLRERLQSTRP